MERPYVICHMFCSLDGKIDGAFMSTPEARPALEEYGRIREFYQCQAILYGTTTMAEGFSAGILSGLPKSMGRYPKEDYVAVSEEENYIVSVDPEGILGWNSAYVEKKGRARAHVIEVLTERASTAYLEYLREFNISYIFAGREALDCGLALHKLKNLFGIDRLMLAGGGTINWSFLQEDLLDELSLVVAPAADGDTSSVSVFERADFLPPRKPAVFRLGSVHAIAGGWTLAALPVSAGFPA